MHPTQNPPTPGTLSGAAPADLTDTPAAVLRRAALYLERHGWCQHVYYDRSKNGLATSTPPADVLGAIGMAVYGGPLLDVMDQDRRGSAVFYAAYGALCHFLAATGRIDSPTAPSWLWTPAEWNDYPTTTKTDVIRALLRAARACERPAPGTTPAHEPTPRERTLR